ncbi:MAG: hypothetical protein VB948_15885 [Pseudomonadales bacterium]|jgi:hypothetical protein
MATPCIAHYGTTIIESAPPEGVAQKDVPIEGQLADTLEFLQLFGFEPLIENFYPGMGRQYIWRRGETTDVDYLEKDNFTSYRAEQRPASAGPREGDTIFRLTHRDPVAIYQLWQERGLGTPLSESAAAAFLAGEQSWLLVRGPDGQVYEVGPSQELACENHRVYVWTTDERVDEVAVAYQKHFGLQTVVTESFHGLGTVQLLSREAPGVSLGLLSGCAQGVQPRWTDDIFVEAGYSHFRLGAIDMPATQRDSREAFPAAGDVGFIHFQDSYLELVQAPAD